MFGLSQLAGSLSRIVKALARFMAVLGGVVLTGLIALTCISVLGRGLNTLGHSDFLKSISEDLAKSLIATGVGPVTGDFELVEAGVAFAIFAFLPICQLAGGHATVDVFTSALPRRANKVIAAFWETVLCAVILLITWRLFVGMLGKTQTGETTFLLQIPVWQPYAASFGAALVAAIVSLYCAFVRIAELFAGKRLLPDDRETAS